MPPAPSCDGIPLWFVKQRTSCQVHSTARGDRGGWQSVPYVSAHEALPTVGASPTTGSICLSVLAACAQALKAAFTALMTCDGGKVSGAISSLVQRLTQESEGGRKLSDKEQLVLRLNQQYPNDVGVLSAFFLNQVCVCGGGGRAREVPSGWQSSYGQGLAELTIACSL
jgi:hypothetical protein